MRPSSSLSRGSRPLSAVTRPSSARSTSSSVHFSPSSTSASVMSSFSPERTDFGPIEEYEFQPEPEEVTRKLFKSFDLNNDGVINSDELRVLYRSIGLFPQPAEIRSIIEEADFDGNGVIDYDEFREMRSMEQTTCQLNVLVEFKKFAVDRIRKNIITRDCVERVLSAERWPESRVRDIVFNFMRADADRDGRITYKDLHKHMMECIPDEWLDWLAVNVRRGVADDQILQILEANGFKSEQAQSLLRSTKENGRAPSQRSYADNCTHYTYRLKA
eukprot:GILI01049411.1.p1 GENE.GILI01049411.1~~GILI01049411.1.p1  ORF type:complete len:274 (+),score=46.19 GILI01049411.1:136-957(+)